METTFDSKKTALLVIDMQNDLVKNNSEYFAPMYSMVQKNNVVKNLIRLTGKARQKGLPIAHIKTIRRRDGTDVIPTITDFMLQGLLPKEMPPILIEGTQGADFIDELRPATDDYIVAKRRSSAFHRTDLDLILRARKIDTLIIGGVVTYGCVENTIRSARELDYHVIVLSDCCAAVMADAHDYAMKKVFPALGRVRSTEEILNVM